MTIKWNWGTKIWLVYLGFVLFMTSLVVLCFQQDVNLVTPNYYAEELKFQQVIDGQQNNNALSASLTVEDGTDFITVLFPAELGRIDSGTVTFYKPDNLKLDFSVSIKGGLFYQFKKADFGYGLYHVKVSWFTKGLRYFDEQKLFVQKDEL